MNFNRLNDNGPPGPDVTAINDNTATSGARRRC